MFLQDIGSAAESWGQTVDVEDVLKFTKQIPDFSDTTSRVIKTKPKGGIIDWKRGEVLSRHGHLQKAESPSLEIAHIHLCPAQVMEAPRLSKTQFPWLLACKSQERSTFRGL